MIIFCGDNINSSFRGRYELSTEIAFLGNSQSCLYKTEVINENRIRNEVMLINTRYC